MYRGRVVIAVENSGSCVGDGGPDVVRGDFNETISPACFK